jgi:2-keto-4-pentenoate hydratase/2-oxohepta-3-ene-1,7-dioic acid hydratase in catechol pathway
MRIANHSGRLVVVKDELAFDVEKASDGRFGPDPQDVYESWEEFAKWAGDADLSGGVAFKTSELGPPVPRPRQVFAIGLNYAKHAAEAGLDLPPSPLTFTKFPTCLTGPDADVVVATDCVDWEVELVAVIGSAARKVKPQDAWSHVAGLTVGQDISARDVQTAGSPPQFSLGKSFEGFGPTGPWVVTLDEFESPDDLALGCSLNGEPVQGERTNDLIFSVPELISRLSHICPLLPGDIIFTGTPSGVGNARDPKWFIQPGDELVSEIEGIGSITTRFVER